MANKQTHEHDHEHEHGADCDHDLGPAPEPIRRAHPKVGRNEACPCGSGKKFKKCHGAQASA